MSLLTLGSPLFCLAEGTERLVVEREAEILNLVGKPLVDAQDGGTLFLATDGQIWALQPEQIRTRSAAETPFVAAPRSEIEAALKRELGDEFKFHSTANFLIAYNTTPAYAQWCGGLYERLYRALTNYWQRRGLTLQTPEFPMVAIAFATREDYLDYAQEELGPSAAGIIGYYSLKTNRVAMYDLTGVEGLDLPRGRASNAKLINRVLSQPQAEPNVATLIHEGTHQIAYNIGLQTRYADNPLWLSEGLAAYFETPDLSSSKGWRGIGKVNRPRLIGLKRYLNHRPADSLQTLLTNDERLRHSETAADAYAEAWGLCYFLLKRREREFAAYLAELAALKPLGQTTPSERLEVFERHFGDLQELDRRFVNEMATLRDSG